jgi:hypothetical protein
MTRGAANTPGHISAYGSFGTIVFSRTITGIGMLSMLTPALRLPGRTRRKRIEIEIEI